MGAIQWRYEAACASPDQFQRNDSAGLQRVRFLYDRRLITLARSQGGLFSLNAALACPQNVKGVILAEYSSTLDVDKCPTGVTSDKIAMLYPPVNDHANILSGQPFSNFFCRGPPAKSRPASWAADLPLPFSRCVSSAFLPDIQSHGLLRGTRAGLILTYVSLAHTRPAQPKQATHAGKTAPRYF